MISLVIEVSTDDEVELRDLAATLPGETNGVLESRALDGVTLMAAVVSVTIPTISLVKAWLMGRVELKKRTSVQLEGRTYRAYSASEVIRIEEAIKSMLSEDTERD